MMQVCPVLQQQILKNFGVPLPTCSLLLRFISYVIIFVQHMEQPFYNF